MLEADKILVTVGRKPASSGFDLDLLDLDMDGPSIRIHERCRTSMRGVFAIGDVTGEPMLAHRAMAQGEMVAEIIAGRLEMAARLEDIAMTTHAHPTQSEGFHEAVLKSLGHAIHI